MTARYTTIFNFVALSILLFISVDIFYTIVSAQLNDVGIQEIAKTRPSPSKGYRRPPLSDYRAITERNIFGSLENASEKIKPSEYENLEPTKLKLALVGTVSGSDEDAAAFIEETDKRRQELYRVGDKVKDATLKAILEGKVVLSVDGKDEILTMEEPSSRRSLSTVRERDTPPSAAVTPQRRSAGVTRTLRRSDIQRSLEDVSGLLEQARIVPAPSEDGFAVSNIQSGSLFARMGLRNGDIVQGIDNKPITGTEDVVSFYQELGSASNITLDIIRNGREMSLPFRIR
ncbi:MAG: PDZ domain-containing protein [Deltaproteobacteria bacterium]|nr:PDZ domain-containing protein [Deltaproteobacteria bacterium]